VQKRRRKEKKEAPTRSGGNTIERNKDFEKNCGGELPFGSKRERKKGGQDGAE
jgi:hypothetical protein